MAATQEIDNTIYVGDRPFMNYVSAIVMQFLLHDRKKVIIKARGKHISRAVDVAETAIKQFLPSKAEIVDISIDSEEIANREERMVRVSTISIVLSAQ